MREIRYTAPTSLADALQLLSDGGDGARPFGGGTDLLLQLRAGTRQAGRLIDLKRIRELSILTYDPQSGLRIGAAVPCFRVTEDPQIGEIYPGLVEAAQVIGSMQIQSRATLGGNLCNGSPAADAIPALIASGGSAVVAGTKGCRTTPVADFVLAPGRTALGLGELVVELVVPPPAPRTADCYRRFTPRNEMDIAVVGVAASVTLDGPGAAARCTAARIALGAVGPKPLLAVQAAAALIGKPIDEAALSRAGDLAAASARPIDDMRGTAQFRRAVTAALVRRVVAEAARRARARS